MSRKVLISWMIDVARPVLKPLVASTFFRMVDQLAGIALFGLAVWFIMDYALWNGATVDGEGLGFAGTLWPMALTLIGLSLLKGFARYLEQFLGHLVAFRALEILRTHTFGKLWPQAPGVMYGARSGDMLERLTKDIDRIEVFYAHTIAPTITGILTPLIVVLSMGFWGSWEMAGVLAVGLVLQIVAVPMIGLKATKRNAEAISRLRGELTQSVTDSVQGRTEVVGYGLQRERQLHAERVGAEIVARGESTSRIIGARKLLALLCSWITPVLVLAVGLHQSAKDWVWGAGWGDPQSSWLGPTGPAQYTESMPLDYPWFVDGMTPFIAAVAAVVAFRTFVPSKEFEELQQTLDNTFASAERLYTLTHRAPDVRSAEQPVGLPSGALGFSISDATYAYPDHDRAPALRDASVEIPAGKHTVIVGTSGSGKSTLVHLLMRYADPVSGSVSVHGDAVVHGDDAAQRGAGDVAVRAGDAAQRGTGDVAMRAGDAARVGADDTATIDLKTVDLAELRSAVTYVSQQPFLFNRTVRENLLLGNPEATDADLQKALEIAHIADHVAKLDQGLDTPVGELAGTWSGGQRSRLALARALVVKPRVLVLDEYTAHLNPELADRVRDAVRRHFPELTIVEVTHRVKSALGADHVIVVDAGEVVQEGSAAELNSIGDGSDGEELSAFHRLLSRDKH